MTAHVDAQSTFVDATFGRGGHTRALLSQLPPAARVIAIDRDQSAIASGAALAEQDQRLKLVQARFSELGAVLGELGLARVSGVIMDLGVSSPQLDDPSRGFSFRGDGPIDMRMDQNAGEPAAEWLNRVDEQDLARVIAQLGEERHARRVARAIVAARPLTTTGRLASVVRAAIPSRARNTSRNTGSDTATRTFQAIRMHVNEELEEVEAGIGQAFEHLQSGGRLAVISFHSLEDRLVKRSFRRLASGPQLPRNLPVRASELVPAGRLVAGPVRAGRAELERNPRARSATLRVLERNE